jgi:hypothetical protein
MKNDLISRESLLMILNKNNIFEKITNAEGKNVIEIINEQPIAYSVEKVIAELEGRKEELIEELDYEIILGQYRAYQDAIKVIRESVE